MAVTASLLQNTKFEELCRLCGSKTDMLAVHIFEDEGTFSELGKKIYNCLQLQIHQQDELPKLLCDHCLVKLEMFWDFKDRSFRTEQFLIELYKQLKNNGTQQPISQQCIVALDTNGIVLQVPHHEILPNDLPSDIDISQLDRRENPNTADYAMVLKINNQDIDTDHLNNLELNNQNLTGQENLVALQSHSADRFAEGNLNLMQQDFLTDESFKIHPDLQMPMAVDESVYPNNVKHNLSSGTRELEEHDSVDYPNHKDSLVMDPNLSDNSLEVDSHFDRIISYSSDSQIDHIQRPDESDSNMLPDQDITDVAGVIDKEDYLLDGDTIEHREDLVNLSANFESRQSQFFKYENEVSVFQNVSEQKDGEDKAVILNYKEEISLDGADSLKDKNSKSLAIPSFPREQANLDHTSKGQLKPGNKMASKVCSVCGKLYKSNYKLAEHMTKHTGERPYKCNSCDKAFRSKIGLAQHEAKHTGQYELSCPTCGKGFQCRSYLMVHQRVHSDVKPYHCTTCGINFKTKQSLLDHTNRHLGVKPFSCSLCNRGFITKSLCVAHERTHTGVDNRKYMCKICQKRFVSKSYLQTHFRIHTGEKSFICEVCGKGFLTRVDLKIHFTMHTGEKSYVCEMCGKAFARRDALKCHRRLHTGERPYRCDICGRTFTQFTPMANHKRHHTGEKPFSCETCGKTFVSKSTMVSHQKKHLRDEKNIGDKDGSQQIVKEEIVIDEHPI